MSPKLCAAIVAAQGAATTVDNDGHNQKQNYKYATQAAIACKARQAMGLAGIALVQAGWRSVPMGNREGVNADFVIVHKEGAVSPVFSATMHVGMAPDKSKALAAGLSILRKYVLAGLLNMGWSDPSEDVDSGLHDKPRGGGRSNGHQKPAAQQAGSTVKPDKLRQDANGWRKFLIDRGCPSDEVFSFALGIDGAPPKPAPRSMLKSLCEAGHAVQKAHANGPNIQNHDELLAFLETTDRPILWAHGKITAAGESFDKSSANGH
jgi:hypothetical protein